MDGAVNLHTAFHKRQTRRKGLGKRRPSTLEAYKSKTQERNVQYLVHGGKTVATKEVEEPYVDSTSMIVATVVEESK